MEEEEKEEEYEKRSEEEEEIRRYEGMRIRGMMIKRMGEGH